MASTIVVALASPAAPVAAFTPSNRFTLADQTATTAVQTLGAAATTFRAAVIMKTYVVGTDLTGPCITLEAADNLAFTTNQTIVAAVTAKLVASTTAVQHFILEGQVLVASKGFMRVGITFESNGTGVFDIQFDAV